MCRCEAILYLVILHGLQNCDGVEARMCRIQSI